MSRYKRTKLFIRPNSPLWSKDMIARQVYLEDCKENSTVTPYKPIPFTPQGALEKSVGLMNFFKTNVVGFVME